jgi:hypothetical protein
MNAQMHNTRSSTSSVFEYAVFVFNDSNIRLMFLGIVILHLLTTSIQLSSPNFNNGIDTTLRHCLDLSGGLWSPEENSFSHIVSSNNKSPDFRLLCTSIEKRIVWGSYKLRCNDLKRWVDRCVPNVDITTNVSIEQLHKRWAEKSYKNKTNNNTEDNGNEILYNATIFVKSMSRRDYPQFGKKIIDIVDEYNWNESKIPPEMHLILQTRWQGEEMYPNHSFSVVEHWYNSYPADMIRSGGYPEYIPPVTQKSSRRLRIASIWNTKRRLGEYM